MYVTNDSKTTNIVSVEELLIFIGQFTTDGELSGR